MGISPPRLRQARRGGVWTTEVKRTKYFTSESPTVIEKRVLRRIAFQPRMRRERILSWPRVSRLWRTKMRSIPKIQRS